MEPPNLDPRPLGDEALEALLKETRLAALPDSGFSAAVLRALPPPRRMFPWRIVAVGSLGGCAGLLAAFFSGASSIKISGLADGAAALTSRLGDALARNLTTDPWSIAVLIIGLSLAFVAWQSGQSEESYF